MYRQLTLYKLKRFRSMRDFTMVSYLMNLRKVCLPTQSTHMIYSPGRRGVAPLQGELHHHPGLFQGMLYTRMLRQT